MTTEPDDLELNAINPLNHTDRFTKKSRLILESHSHCEVPAGCGGVVLRWRDPDLGAELQTLLWSEGEPKLWLDGKPVNPGRLRLAWGAHALALELDRPSAGFVLAAVDRPSDALGAPNDATPTVEVVTALDGSWRYTDAPPPDGWTDPDFDDAAWSLLIGGTPPTLDWESGKWSYDRCADRGAVLLGPALPAERIWVRKRVEVTRG